MNEQKNTEMFSKALVLILFFIYMSPPPNLVMISNEATHVVFAGSVDTWRMTSKAIVLFITECISHYILLPPLQPQASLYPQTESGLGDLETSKLN